MNPEDIKQYWTNCATEHGADVHATTPAATAKQLEIDALWRHLKDMPAETRVLEAGCGNGINCIELAKRLSSFHFDGFDYVPEMIEAARARKEDNTYFAVGNILTMNEFIEGEYNVVITDRCIINLDTWEKQKRAIKALTDKVCPGGRLLMIENVVQGRKTQNRLRSFLGLPERPLMPPFNLFLDEEELCGYLVEVGMIMTHEEDFSSLHDLCLYVLAPEMDAYPDGRIDYNHPLVKIATELSIKTSLMTPSIFGAFGQNRLFVCRKPA